MRQARLDRPAGYDWKETKTVFSLKNKTHDVFVGIDEADPDFFTVSYVARNTSDEISVGRTPDAAKAFAHGERVYEELQAL